jgi:NAD(P)H-flavin reductase
MNLIDFPAQEKAPVSSKQSVFCELVNVTYINKDIFRLDFVWPGIKPKAGQFFMIKPKRSAVFLARPISMALWQPAETDQEFIRKEAQKEKTPYQRYLTKKILESNTIRFYIARRGKGTRELASMRIGDEAELIGPLGNTWTDFLDKVKPGSDKPIALVGGGIGIAPLQALLYEKLKYSFDFYAGFKKDLNTDEKAALLGGAYLKADNIIVAAENGKEDYKGLIPDFLEPEQYAAVCACGPEPMLKAVAAKCKTAAVPCFISMERRMACGVGACLGCAIKTVNGNRRCCADGPIFKADEVIFDGE